ncbi:MAG: DUF1624 domain-containing protein [Chitinophagales bacterium]|nr:DUF1624 domain-containing protein [Chitinophagales bacterium]
MEQFDKHTMPLRVNSLDILKGAIMVLMAVDHVRVYSGIPSNSFEPAFFFTRWITHFCAPGFAFLAGTSAFLYGQRVNDKKKLSGFLLTRGLFLILLEITVIRFFWTFNFNYSNFFLAGVIWMLGWCMVIMALLTKLKPLAVGIVGLIIIASQQAFKFLPKVVPNSLHVSFGKFWEFIYPSGLQGIEGVTILYVIVPWIGVMAAGYGFGLILLMEKEKRNKLCRIIGISAITVFLIAGSLLANSKPTTNESPAFIFRLLNQNKYPASQLYLLMTLGPIIALIPFAEKARGWLFNILSVFGRVPLFYYLLYIPLIHLSALVVMYLSEGVISFDLYSTAPFTFLPEENRWSLPLLYFVFFINVIMLFFLCKWYSKFKKKYPYGILKFF